MSHLLILGDHVADLDQQTLAGPAGSTNLTTKEAQLLAYLAGRPGKTVSRETLLQDVWGYDASANTRAVDHLVRRLRKKLGDDGKDPRWLHTVYGEGYRLALSTPRPSGCIGRDEALAELDRLHEQGVRVIALIGPGGVGKTTLAMAWTAARSRTVVDVTDDASPALELAEALHLPGAPLDQVVAALRARPEHVVVIDNAERAPEACDTLAAALPTPVLLTSRVASEAASVVVRLDGLDAEPAVELFRSRARKVDASFRGDAGVRTLVEALEGHPLSILLAASRVGVLTPEQMVEHLERAPLSLLRDPAFEGPARHADLERVFAASWEGLDETLRTTLGTLAWFGRPQPVDVLEEVLGPAALDAAQRLHASSLVHPRTVQGQRVLGMPDALVAFVADHRGAEAPERAACRAYVHRRCRGSRADWPGVLELDRALRDGEEPLLRAVWAVRSAERGASAAALVPLEGAEDPILCAARGVVLSARGQLEEALEAFAAAEHALGDGPEWMAERGFVALRHGDLDAATADLTAAIRILERRRDHGRAALWRGRLAWVHRRAGRDEQAEHALRAAVEAAPTGTEAAIVAAMNLAHLLVVLGRRDEAEDVAAEIDGDGLRPQLAVQLTSLHALLAIEAGDVPRARETTAAAAKAAARAGLRTSVWTVRLNLATLLLADGLRDEAEPILRSALLDATVAQDPRIAGQAWCLDAARHQLGDTPDQAEEAWQRGLALLADADDGRHARMRLLHTILVARSGDQATAAHTLDAVHRAVWPEIHDAVRASLERGALPAPTAARARQTSAGRLVLRLLQAPA